MELLPGAARSGEQLQLVRPHHGEWAGIAYRVRIPSRVAGDIVGAGQFGSERIERNRRDLLGIPSRVGCTNSRQAVQSSAACGNSDDADQRNRDSNRG